MNLKDFLNKIKKWAFDVDTHLPLSAKDERSLKIYVDLRDGYRLMKENLPSNVDFEKFLNQESNNLLNRALQTIDSESKNVPEISNFRRFENAMIQVFFTWFPDKSNTPLATWQMRI